MSRENPYNLPTTYLTPEEHRAIELAGELATLLGGIIGDGPPSGHDYAELVLPIHQIQHTVMAQAAARAYPERYRLLGETLRNEETL